MFSVDASFEYKIGFLIKDLSRRQEFGVHDCSKEL